MTDMLEKPAQALDDLAHRAEQQGGAVAKAAEDLHADAAFLRKIGGETDSEARPARPPRARATRRSAGGGRRALIVIGGAFVAGIVLASFLQWRSLVEPRH